MATITQDIAFTDASTVAAQKVRDIVEFYGYTGGGNGGDVRSFANSLLAGTALGVIGGNDNAASFVPKFNSLNDPDGLLAALVDAAGGVLIDAAGSQLYVERTSPTTVAGVGDPVGTIIDPVSGLTFTAPTDAARAVLREDGAGWRYLESDGIDDGYRSTADFDPGATDKMFVLFAGRKRSDDDAGMLFEASPNAGDNDGAVSLNHSTAIGDAQRRTWFARTRGATAVNFREGRIYPAPDLAVIDAAFDHSAATTAAQNVFLRNGAEMDAYDNDGPTGVGDFQPRLLNLFARNNAASLSAAADCNLIAILPGATTEATRNAIRRIAANRIGVTLP